MLVRSGYVPSGLADFYLELSGFTNIAPGTTQVTGTLTVADFYLDLSGFTNINPGVTRVTGTLTP